MAKWPIVGVRDPQDSRQRLAALITTPENRRFAEVMVNRTWQRLIGWGLVDSVDDWEKSTPRHPQTLQYLSREFVLYGYDLQYLQRLIFQSRLYQTEAQPWSLPKAIYLVSTRSAPPVVA